MRDLEAGENPRLRRGARGNEVERVDAARLVRSDRPVRFAAARAASDSTGEARGSPRASRRAGGCLPSAAASVASSSSSVPRENAATTSARSSRDVPPCRIAAGNSMPRCRCMSVSRYSVKTMARSRSPAEQAANGVDLRFPQGSETRSGRQRRQHFAFAAPGRQGAGSVGHDGGSSATTRSPCGSPSGSARLLFSRSNRWTPSAPRSGGQQTAPATTRSKRRACAEPRSPAMTRAGARNFGQDGIGITLKERVHALLVGAQAHADRVNPPARLDPDHRPRSPEHQRASSSSVTPPRAHSDVNARASPLCGVAVSSST